MGFNKAVESASGLDELYPLLAQNRLTAGWHKARRSLWESPRTGFEPGLWHYSDAVVALDKAGEWISTDLAERRNLVMFNPGEVMNTGESNDYASVRTLITAYQMIKPGEHADAHRHTPAALRVILHAEEGAYTVVDGVEIPMRTGDVLLTPGFSWHSHYNVGSANAYWVDVLNVPMVQLLEPMFYEEHPNKRQAVTTRTETHPLRICLDAATDPRPAAAGHVLVERDGEEHLPAMSLKHHFISSGGSVGAGKSTASRVFVVQSGSGIFECNDRTWEWSKGDVFTVPGWHAFSVSAHSESTILEVSDERALQKLGLLIVEDSAS